MGNCPPLSFPVCSKSSHAGAMGDANPVHHHAMHDLKVAQLSTPLPSREQETPTTVVRRDPRHTRKQCRSPSGGAGASLLSSPHHVTCQRRSPRHTSPAPILPVQADQPLAHSHRAAVNRAHARFTSNGRDAFSPILHASTFDGKYARNCLLAPTAMGPSNARLHRRTAANMAPSDGVIVVTVIGHRSGAG